MSEPVAMVKAKTLQRYASARGAPLHELTLALSDAEGLELLTWLLAQQDEPSSDLVTDIRRARHTADPWPVLEHFQLLGLKDRKSTRLNSSHPVSSRMPSSA